MKLHIFILHKKESQPESNEKFPRKFRHKLCCLRQELIDSFVELV